MEKENRHVSLYSAIAIVVANIIGVGVFTSLGFQVQGGFTDMPALLLLWVVGGIIALCGALTYGEIGTVFPKSGGEYQYLTNLFHPFVGFLSGWVSSTVAFAAPVALAGVAMATYIHKVFPGMHVQLTAIGVVGIITAIHATTLSGFKFQNIFSTGKVILILIFIICGFSMGEHQVMNLQVTDHTWDLVFSGGFAISLVYVAYAYSGWNAAAYLAGEIKNPRRNLPKSLVGGTIIVMFLYFLLNYVFLYTIPLNDIAAEQAKDFSKPVEVGYFSADYIFGIGGANTMALVIAILLVSTISAMVIAGPRVLAAMGQDISLLKFFSKTTKAGIPANAVIGQSIVSVILILTASFDQLLLYVGFTLQLFTFLTVLGVFIIRYRKLKGPHGAYRTFGYPITPIIFLALSGWSLWFIAHHKPKESLYGLLTLAVGAVVWFVDRMRKKA